MLNTSAEIKNAFRSFECISTSPPYSETISSPEVAPTDPTLPIDSNPSAFLKSAERPDLSRCYHDFSHYGSILLLYNKVVAFCIVNFYYQINIVPICGLIFLVFLPD
jgi:hypothetical protein